MLPDRCFCITSVRPLGLLSVEPHYASFTSPKFTTNPFARGHGGGRTVRQQPHLRQHWREHWASRRLCDKAVHQSCFAELAAYSSNPAASALRFATCCLSQRFQLMSKHVPHKSKHVPHKSKHVPHNWMINIEVMMRNFTAHPRHIAPRHLRIALTPIRRHVFYGFPIISRLCNTARVASGLTTKAAKSGSVR